MNEQFLHLLNFVLISRLVYTFSDATISGRQFAAMVAIQIVGLLSFDLSLAWWVLLVLMVGQAILFQVIERRSGRSEGIRTISLVVSVLLLSVFFSPRIGLSFNAALFGALAGLGQYTTLASAFATINWARAGCFLMGFLLVLNEANLVLRSQLRRLNMAPRGKENNRSGDTGLTQEEYNTGRIIGMLERTIIYIAVLNNEVTAIGLVLAAKAFTRYKEFEDRDFAEYVLIGTLLSAFVAVVVAMVVKGING